MSRGNQVFARIGLTPQLSAEQRSSTDVNDLFLHALFARMAMANNEVIEFETKYNPNTNTIELQVPTVDMPSFDQMLGMQRGDNFKRFVNWLIGSDTLTTLSDATFIAATSMQPWFGSTLLNVSGERLALSLPTTLHSVIGCGLRSSSLFSGRIRIYLNWIFISGANSDFTLRTSVNVNDPNGSAATVSGDITISTAGLTYGDAVETLIFDTGLIITPNNIINILINRNFDASPDPHTELAAVVGLRLEYDNT